MSKVTVGAPVECTDGPCGELVALVIDPAKKTITHYVVRVKSDGVERMVPTELVGASTPDKLELQCTQAELNELESFTRDELLAEYLPDPSATNSATPTTRHGHPGRRAARSQFVPFGRIASRTTKWSCARHARPARDGTSAARKPWS
jgi:hypothetical protein